MSREPATSSLNPPITLQGQVHQYKRASIPAAEIRPVFLSVYIFDIDEGFQAQQITTSFKDPDVHLIQQLRVILHLLIPNALTFNSAREWILGDEAPSQFQMVIYGDRRPTCYRFRTCNGPACSEELR